MTLSIRNISLAYSAAEDRLIMLVTARDGTQQALLLTRRLVERLVNGLASVLEKSSITATKAPAEMRDDIILLEHHEALSGTPSRTPASSGGGQPSQPSRVSAAIVTGVAITIKPTHFSVVIRSPKREAIGFDAGRPLLHQLLGLLTAKAQEAGWNLSLEAGWLDTDQVTISMN